MGQHLDSSHDKIHFSGVSIREKAVKFYATKLPKPHSVVSQCLPSWGQGYMILLV